MDRNGKVRLREFPYIAGNILKSDSSPVSICRLTNEARYGFSDEIKNEGNVEARVRRYTAFFLLSFDRCFLSF